MQASVKVLSDSLHPFVITLFRALLVFIIMLPILVWRGLGAVKTSSVKLQVIRGSVGGVCMLCMFAGFSLVSLPEATSLLFTVPIFAAILSVIFLSEHVGIQRWSAVLIGFSGILVIARPDISFNLGHFLLLSAAIAWSISIIIAKKLAENDTIISITFWQAMGCVQLIYLLGIAGLGTLGHALVYASLKLGKVSVLLPLDYIRIIWSTLLGFTIFGSLPTLHIYLGTMLIICSTAFISYREIYKNKEI